MNDGLPHHFIADLPPGATLNATLVAEACGNLRRNRARCLDARTTEDMLHLIAAVAEGWLQPGNTFRQLALAAPRHETGFGPETLAAGIDGFFREITVENLRALVKQDLGHAGRLDRFVASPEEGMTSRQARAVGPELLVHVAAGNLPVSTWMHLVLGLVMRSAQFVKCATGASLLPRLLAHSLYEADPKIGCCLELAEWPRERTDLEISLLAGADCITVTGSDEAVAEIRRRAPGQARLVAHGHRVGIGFVAREALAGTGAAGVLAAVAEDIAAWNQLGCLSPHVIYVEDRGAVKPEEFAARLAEALARKEGRAPRGPLVVAEAAGIANQRAGFELRASASPDTLVWASPGSTAWTVVYEADPAFRLSCLNRFVFVKPVPDLAAALHACGDLAGRISTVALAAGPARLPDLAAELARRGVARICPPGWMQRPPLAWRHDGRPSLGDLVTWTDWEQPA